MLFTLIGLFSALAQQPPVVEVPPDNAGTEEPLTEASLPAYVYTTQAVTLLRWLGNDTPSGQVDAGRRIEVIVEDGDMVRVRSGTDFGWVSRALLTVDAPEQP